MKDISCSDGIKARIKLASEYSQVALGPFLIWDELMSFSQPPISILKQASMDVPRYFHMAGWFVLIDNTF